MSTAERHWTDEEIVRWVDERNSPEGIRVTEHLGRCEACRARIAGVEALFAALGTEPPSTTDAEMAAQRNRILQAVRSRPRVPGRRLSRRLVWLPAIAAAIAALLLWAPRWTRSPETAPSPDAPAGGSAPLAVVVDATRAAEEVVADIRLPDVEVSTLEEWSGSAELEREFAELPSEDREAILTELTSADFNP